MKHQLRSSFSTQGRRMAGARALWTANGMKKEQMGKPYSYSQFLYTIRPRACTPARNRPVCKGRD